MCIKCILSELMFYIKAARYSVAGHQLIQGTLLKRVQECCGIRLLRSTAGYTRVAQSFMARDIQANGL